MTHGQLVFIFSAIYGCVAYWYCKAAFSDQPDDLKGMLFGLFLLWVFCAAGELATVSEMSGRDMFMTTFAIMGGGFMGMANAYDAQRKKKWEKEIAEKEAKEDV